MHKVGVRCINTNHHANMRVMVVQDDGSVRFGPKPVATHYECGLLAYIHRHDIDIFPYIGVSKLSCELCSLYFQAYRAVKHPPIWTRGRHGTMPFPWICPTTGSLSDVEECMRVNILDNLRRRLQAVESDIWQ